MASNPFLEAHLEAGLEQKFRTGGGFGGAEMAPRKRKHNADEKALPEVTAAERAAVEKYRAKKKPEPNAAKTYDKMTSQKRTAIDKFLARNAANPAPRLKVLGGQIATISPDHPDNLVGLVAT